MSDKLFDAKTHPPIPEQGRKILAYGNGYFFEAEFDDGFWCSIGGDDFTHWTYLPPVPSSGHTTSTKKPSYNESN